MRRWSSSSTPRPFSLSQSFFLLLMVVAGGSGYLPRALRRGAASASLLPEWLRFAWLDLVPDHLRRAIVMLLHDRLLRKAVSVG